MKKYILSCLFLILISCSTQLYVPVQGANTVSIEELKQGRALYVNNCASCHQLYLPKQFTNEVWIHNLNEMQVRAKITDIDKDKIYKYLANAPK